MQENDLKKGLLCGIEKVRQIEFNDINFAPLTNIYTLCAHKKARHHEHS